MGALFPALRQNVLFLVAFCAQSQRTSPKVHLHDAALFTGLPGAGGLLTIPKQNPNLCATFLPYNLFKKQYHRQGKSGILMLDSKIFRGERKEIMVHILIVDDDPKLNKTVCIYLNDCGFETTGVLNAQAAYEALNSRPYDLIVSDIMMPGVDGFAFARSVRQLDKHIPILFMSAKDDLPSKQKGFQLGIDDYMVKPVELAELEMRVRALLRRANIEAERRLTVGNLVLDADGMTAEIDGKEVPVSKREFNILYKLLSYPKKTFTRAQLMDEFWDADTDASLRAVDVYITKLRDKCSACDGFEIKTVRGLGYKAVLL